MGTYIRELSESYPMNINMTGFRVFFKNLCVFVIWMKVLSASKGLIVVSLLEYLFNFNSYKVSTI